MAEGTTIDEALIAHLYSDALHDGNWNPALERLADVLGATETTINFHVPGGPMELGRTTHSTGRIISTEAVTRYVDFFANVDPKRAILENRRVGFVFNDADHFSDDFVKRDPFYQEFSRPMNSRHTLDMLLSRSPSQEVYLASMRSARQGHYDSEVVAKFQQASRHFLNVAKLRSSIVSAEKVFNHAKAGLDALTFGIVVLDRNAKVVAANSAAVCACASDEFLALSSGCFSINSAAINQALNQAVHRCLTDRSGGGATLRVPRRNGQVWMISIVPLPVFSALAVQGVPGALILIGDGNTELRARSEDLTAIYGLTIAEAELAILLGRGGSLTEAAERRGVKISTARSQLHSILQKMQIQRQADLIRILAALPANFAAR